MRNARGGETLHRIDGRTAIELRPVRISTGVLAFAEGSALIEAGKTRVLCAVTVENRVPPFLQGQGRGWVTAEYAMLPRSTPQRTAREVNGRGGRTHEIQRLIGRSLRAVIDLPALGERTLTVDCDVLQADGGTRTAAITGAYVALYESLKGLVAKGVIPVVPLMTPVAAVSVGRVLGETFLDLCYEEDSRAEADCNVVKTGAGGYVEVQGTAEGKPFSKGMLDEILALADKGLDELFQHQRAAIDVMSKGAAGG